MDMKRNRPNKAITVSTVDPVKQVGKATTMDLTFEQPVPLLRMLSELLEVAEVADVSQPANLGLPAGLGSGLSATPTHYRLTFHSD